MAEEAKIVFDFATKLFIEMHESDKKYLITETINNKKIPIISSCFIYSYFKNYL